MKQVLLNKKTGAIEVLDVPDPDRRPGQILVTVRASVISAGTESAVHATAGRSLLQRVVEKPNLIRKGIDLLRNHGISALRAQLDAKTSGYEVLGYSCAGVVVESDPSAPDLSPGTRVACGGVGYAMHAERIVVPHRLTARIPDGVSDESAAYATIGAIALQGIRQAGAVLGENVAVIGLGLVGLLTSQLLKAAGCNVIGIDPSPHARERALQNGCLRVADLPDAKSVVSDATDGYGADAVIICAATSDHSPVVLAGEIARSRGRVVMVGATGMDIPRETYFKKELTLALSRSYGPGRYDPSYEEAGIDYPIDYVRFTEQRNMQAVLDLIANGAIDPARLTTHRFALEAAPSAYALLNDRSVDRVGIVLTYKASSAPVRRLERSLPPAGRSGHIGVSLIGAGEYASNVLIPLLKNRDGILLRGVAARRPDHSRAAAERFGFSFAASSAEEIFRDSETNAVIIATRHDSHASLTASALAAGKHVWCEKPLALHVEELARVEQALGAGGSTILAVGFNRRFSPLANRLLELRTRIGGPIMVLIRVNAGKLPPDHWTQDPAIGGGRLLGEGCHFFDLLCFLADSTPIRVHTIAYSSDRRDLPPRSNFSSTVSFADGSVGTVLYSSDGSQRLAKERIELFCGGSAAVLDDFRTLHVFEPRGEQEFHLRRQDKGQAAMMGAFLEAIRGNTPFPQTLQSILQSSRLTIAAQRSLDAGQQVFLEEGLVE